MAESYIRISDLTPTNNVGLSDLFIVSQFNTLPNVPDDEKYISKCVSSDVLTKHIYNQVSGEIEERIAQEIGKIGKIGDVVAQISCISTDLGDAVSAILGLDACRIKFKVEVNDKINFLSNNTVQTSANVVSVIDTVSTALSTEVVRNLGTISTDLYEKIYDVSSSTSSLIDSISCELRDYSKDLVSQTSVKLSTDIYTSLSGISTDLSSMIELCTLAISGESRKDIDYNRLHINRIETLSIYYDKAENNIMLAESVNMPEIYAKLNRDEIFIDLLSDLTLDSMISCVECDKTNLSVWFKVGNPPKAQLIVFPLSVFHHNYVFDYPYSGLSVNHPISGNISVGVDFYTLTGMISNDYYTKTNTNNLVSTVSADVYSKSNTNLKTVSADVYTKSKTYANDTIKTVSADVISKSEKYTKDTVSTVSAYIKNNTYTKNEIAQISSFVKTNTLTDVSNNYVSNTKIKEISSSIKSDISTFILTGDISSSISSAISSIIKDNVYNKNEIAQISSFVKTNTLTDVSNNYVKKNTLSVQTWYLYTDSAPTTPIPFNIVLSVA